MMYQRLFYKYTFYRVVADGLIYLILIPSIPLCYGSLIYLFMSVKHNRYVTIT
jgi:hypothetical protein